MKRSRERTVLVVEDDEGVRRAMVRTLAYWRCRTFEASRVEGAIEVLDTEPVDAILLDIGLGDRRGVEVARYAAALIPAPRVIVATGDARPSETVELLELGAEVVLEKPLSFERLQAALFEPPQPALLEPLVRRLVGSRSKPELERLVGDIMVQEALSRASGRLSHAADLLGITRQALHRQLRTREPASEEEE